MRTSLWLGFVVVVALFSAGCITSGSSQTVHPEVGMRPYGGVYSGICERAATRFIAHAATLDHDPTLQQHFASLSLAFQQRAEVRNARKEEKFSDDFHRYKDSLHVVFGEYGSEIFDAMVIVAELPHLPSIVRMRVAAFFTYTADAREPLPADISRRLLHIIQMLAQPWQAQAQHVLETSLENVRAFVTMRRQDKSLTI